MKIGINALYLLPGKVGGSETYLRNLVKGLAAANKENDYVLFVNRETEGVIASLSANVHIAVCPVTARNRPERILWEQCGLPRYLKRHKIDILLSAGMTAPFFCPIPSVLVLHDLQHVNQPRNYPLHYLLILRSIIYASAKRVDGIIAISRQVKDDIVRLYHIPPEKIEVVHHGVDHNAFTNTETQHDAAAMRARYGLPERYILYAASSLPHKNHERLFQAFADIRRRVPGLKLVLSGARDKGESALTQKIKAMGLDQDILTLGWIPFEDVPALLRASAAFIFPSLHEGFGLPVIEAMACGVPVVCSNIEPLPEIAGEAALFVNPYSPSSIADGIITVLTDQTMRDNLVQKGLVRANEFTWEATARKTLQFMKTIHTKWRTSRYGIS